MFTMVGYYDTLQHLALAAIAGIPDPHVRVSGNDIYVPSLNKILSVFAGGEDFGECRLQSPSLRRLVNQRIAHIYHQAAPFNSWEKDPIHMWKERARTLDIAESLNAFCLNPVASPEYVFVWLMDKLEALPAGGIATIEGTMSLNTTANIWTNGALTFTQTLPAGRYAIVGMRAMHPTCVAARCVFPDISPRPGVLGVGSTYYATSPEFRYGYLGSWGEFEHDAPPTIDILSTATAAALPDIYLDLIQVRAGRR